MSKKSKLVKYLKNVKKPKFKVRTKKDVLFVVDLEDICRILICVESVSEIWLGKA
jgi:hypothetical protein